MPDEPILCGYHHKWGFDTYAADDCMECKIARLQHLHPNEPVPAVLVIDVITLLNTRLEKAERDIEWLTRRGTEDY